MKNFKKFEITYINVNGSQKTVILSSNGINTREAAYKLFTSTNEDSVVMSVKIIK